MPKTMLIDATHIEETRVAVVDGNRLVEYDYESKVRKQLKGSIFLAKVTRVEPSLQAAFVNFGGNRHGFLPFSEIHPDYYRIPVADREALIAAQRAELEEHDEVMEQQEAEIEQKAAQAEQDPAEPAEEEEEDEDIEAIVEVGGEDQPLLDDEEEEGTSAAAPAAVSSDAEEDSDESDYRAPIAMDAASDVLRGPEVDESDLQDDDDYSSTSARNGDESDEEDEGDEDSDDESEDSEDAGFEASADDEAGDEQDENGEENGGLASGERGEGAGPGREGRRDRRFRGRGRGRGRGHGGHGRGRGRHGERDDRSVDTLGGDTAEGDRPFRFNLKRQYKIQEVIKRGQIMLIQVSKEERGNKGAAVTTYLSMPGRYCVLMPNSPRGGGVSRKIASFKERKRMKEMLDELSVPDGMSVILRTAGVTRTKVEIKRDLDYLTRLWNTIREHTLQSTAPALIYEEGNLIKRAIRDLYTRDIDDIYVSGDEGHKAAKEFMKMLMPSHAKKVQEYRNDRIPMFHKFGVENQISDIGEPVVHLKSGGYLVINPTEALVSVDVNSGRATKERHIEETALKTNLEAADEVARQLRLRDLGGLVVVDFIDMEDRRNNRKVEQRLRDALSTDRARIQVGRISSFGLLELSRQRLNPSLAEAQQETCQHCMGTGRVKTLDFSAISIIRALEVEGIKGKGFDIVVTLPTSVAIYIMNNKRKLLTDIERRYGFTVSFVTDDTLSTSQYKLETTARIAPKPSEGISSVSIEDSDDAVDDVSESEEEDSGEETSSDRNVASDRRDDDRAGRRRRGRRGGRGRGRDRGGRERDGQDEGRPFGEDQEYAASGDSDDDSFGNQAPSDEDIDDSVGNRFDGAESQRGDQNSNRNRRRRGGRGRGRNRDRDRGGDREPGSAGFEQSSGGQRGDGAAVRAHETPRAEPRYEPKPEATQMFVASAPSNDGPPPPRDYEVVNQAPEKKKKGWWNKLVE